MVYSNVFMQAGNQDSVQHSMQPDAEITMGMDVDEGSYQIFLHKSRAHINIRNPGFNTQVPGYVKYRMGS